MKKVVSFVLCAIMLLSLFTVGVNAAVSDQHEMVLAGTSGNLYGTVNGITFDMQIKAPAIGSTASVIIKIDAEKLEFVTPAANTPNAVSITSTVGLSTLAHPAGWGNLYKTKADWVTSVAFLGGKTADGKTTYLAIQPEFAAASLPTHASALTSAVTFCLAYKPGVTKDDITASTIKVLTVEEVTAVNQSEAAVITDGAGTEFNYNPTVVSGKENNLKEPTITLDGSPLPAGAKEALATPSVTLAERDNDKGGFTITVTDTTNDTSEIEKYKVELFTETGTSAVKTIDVTTSKTATVDANSSSTAPTAGTKYRAKVTAIAKAAADHKDSAASDYSSAVQAGKLALPAAAISYTNLTKQYTGSAQTATVAYAKNYTAANAGALTVKYGNDKAANATAVGDYKIYVSTAGGTYFKAKTEADSGQVFKITKQDSNATISASTTSVKVNQEFTVTIGNSNGEAITWTVTGNATRKTGDTGTTTATFVASGTPGTAVIKATQGDSATKKGFTDKSVTVTVADKDPSAKPAVTISGAPADGKVNEGDTVTLTANVTNATEANCTYVWKKGETQVGTGTTYEISNFAAADNGTYSVVVTNAETDKSPTSSDVVSVTLEVKTKTTVTVAKKGTATQSEGALNVQGLVNVPSGITWDDVKNKVTATVYKEVEDEEGNKSYTKVTDATLTEGTYYVDIAVADGSTDTHQWSAVAGAGAPSDPITEANYVKVTVNAMVIPVAPAGITVTYVAGEHGTLTGAARESVNRGGKPANVPTVQPAKGYRFIGWSQDGVSVVDPTTVSITASTTFTALYEMAGDPYIKGYEDGGFHPGATATRAELATMLARLSKDFDPEANYAVANGDLASGAWYEPYMKYMIKAGIMNGYEDGSYKPGAEITRAEFAKMLASYLGLRLDATTGFADATGWAAPYINALKQAGIVQGYEDGSFRQDNKLTRAEAVTMINKAVELVYDASAGYENDFTDVGSGHWAYKHIMAAANTPAASLMR